MKNKYLIIGAALLALSFTAFAADTYNVSSGNIPVINSASTTATNLTFGGTTNGIWPKVIPASTSVTNVTRLDASGAAVSLQFTASANETNGGAVIIQLARSISGGSPTNSTGTGLKLDLFATMTNTLPANTATSPNTVIASWNAVAGQSATGHGAEKTWYIYSITTPANVTLTNYSIYPQTR